MVVSWPDRRRLQSARRNSSTVGSLEIVAPLLYLEEDKDFGRISWLINRIPLRRLRAW